MKLEFFTPSYGVCENSFGCATFGFVGMESETESNAIGLPYDFQGICLAGEYEEVLAQIPEEDFQLAIVLFGNAGGENAFIQKLSQKISAPMVGGGGAIDPVTGKKGLITGQHSVAVFLINDPGYSFQVCCENIHHRILGSHRLGFTDPRVLDTIDGVNALDWLNAQRQALGLEETDFEHLTFSDENGINAHLSCVKGKICSGRDLEQTMLLRYVQKEAVQQRMEEFYNEESGITFGCAGLKGILSKPMSAKGIGLFLFGEVCTKDGVSQFGNLMLSKVIITKK